MTRGSASSLVIAALVFGCAQQVAPRPAAVRPALPLLAQSRAASPAPSPSKTPPTPEDSRTEADSNAETSALGATLPLEVPEFSPSLVRLPDLPGKAPVLVVTHGAGGTPDAHCELWARISRGRALLLCIRGRARSPAPADGDYYPDHLTLERETFAALNALRSRFAARIAEGPLYYVGFSQGATMGALMLLDHASEVPRLALVEGGFAQWNVPRAKEFRARGGERVLFVCGTEQCAKSARNASRWFNQAGVAAHLEYVRGAGHSHGGAVETHIAALYPWLVAGDPRFPAIDSDVSARISK
jgi:predicted esterase